MEGEMKKKSYAFTFLPLFFSGHSVTGSHHSCNPVMDLFTRSRHSNHPAVDLIHHLEVRKSLFGWSHDHLMYQMKKALFNEALDWYNNKLPGSKSPEEMEEINKNWELFLEEFKDRYYPKEEEELNIMKILIYPEDHVFHHFVEIEGTKKVDSMTHLPEDMDWHNATEMILQMRYCPDIEYSMLSTHRLINYYLTPTDYMFHMTLRKDQYNWPNPMEFVRVYEEGRGPDNKTKEVEKHFEDHFEFLNKPTEEDMKADENIQSADKCKMA